jgi:hypothetical protein
VAAGVPSDPATVNVNVAAPPAGGGTPPVVLPDPAQIQVLFAFAFKGSTARFTKFTTLQIKGVPIRSKLVVTCKAPKGKKCPAKKFTKKNAFGTVKLKKWQKKKLYAGTKLTATITKTGNYIGAVKILTVRKKRVPKIVTRCLPPGAKKAVGC